MNRRAPVYGPWLLPKKAIAVVVGDPPGRRGPFPRVIVSYVEPFPPTAADVAELAAHVHNVHQLNPRRRMAVRWPVLS